MIALMRRLTLTHWILLAMGLGIFVGWEFPAFALKLKILSTLFLNLVKCIIVPLIFATLVVGIAGHTDDMKAIGRLALKSILYFEIVTTCALVIGLVTVNLVRPGEGIRLPASAEPAKELASSKISFDAVMLHLTPQSLFDAAARNDVLQVVVFAILFGVALGRAQGKPKETMINFFEGLSEVMFKFTGLVMAVAPLGVG